MAGLLEDGNFPEEIYQLEINDEVKGGPEGLSNRQASQLANRTRHLKDRLDNLDPMSIGAETAGTTASEIAALKADPNPFSQYLTPGQAATQYVPTNMANQPLGWPRLNDQGKVPASLLDIASSRYVVVPDEAGRLGLSVSSELTIAAQADTDRLWYLNGGLDPSVIENWIRGQAATISGVSKVFGRAGEIFPEDGDYNANQIAETEERVFVTPEEKLAWTDKQDKLISGETFKTINNIPLLGGGNLAINYRFVGAAPDQHSHPSSDINDFKQGIGKELKGLIKQGSNVHIAHDPVTNEMQISALGTGGDANYIFVNRTSGAQQEHVIDTNIPFDYYPHAYAMKYQTGDVNQIFGIEPYTTQFADNWECSTYMKILDTGIQVVKTISLDLEEGERLFESPLDRNVNTLTIHTDNVGIIPSISSDNGVNGFIPSSSSNYYTPSPPYYRAYKAFEYVANPGVYDGWASAVAPTVAKPQWIGIELPYPMVFDSFTFGNRIGSAGPGAPRRFTLQGSNDRVDWETISDEFVNTNNIAGAIHRYSTNNTKAFLCYRLHITEVNANTTYVMLRAFNLYRAKNFALENSLGEVFTVDANKNFIALEEPLAESIETNGISSVAGLTKAILEANDIVKVVSTERVRVNLDVFPGPQIALRRNPINLKHAKSFGTYNSAGSSNGVPISYYPYSVSFDGVDYYAWVTGQWKLVGALTPDAESATLLLANGMDYTTFSSLTWTHYSQLLEMLDLPLENLWIAQVLSLPSAAHTLFLNTSSLRVDNKDNWKLQSTAEVDIRYGDGYLRFKPATAGEYKFAYRLP